MEIMGILILQTALHYSHVTSQSGQRILITAAKSNSFTMEIRGRCLISISMSMLVRIGSRSFLLLFYPYRTFLNYIIVFQLFLLYQIAPHGMGELQGAQLSLGAPLSEKRQLYLLPVPIQMYAILQQITKCYISKINKYKVIYNGSGNIVLKKMRRYYYIYVSIQVYKKLRTKLMFVIRAGYGSRRSSVLGLFVSLNLFAKRQ